MQGEEHLFVGYCYCHTVCSHVKYKVCTDACSIITCRVMSKYNDTVTVTCAHKLFHLCCLNVKCLKKVNKADIAFCP